MMPKVSVIIPCYKSEKYIRQCVDSVLAQTFKDWEAIFVDDKPSKEMIDIMCDYEDRDSRISFNAWWTKRSPAIARNVGVAKARGDYIAFLDADDWLEPHNLAVMVEYLDDHPEMAWCASYQMIHVGDRVYPIKDLPGTTKEIGGIGGCLYRKRLLDEIEKKYGCVFDESLNHTDDGDLTLRVRHYPAGLIPQVLSHYRWNEEGLTATTKSVEQSWGIVKMCIRRGAWDFLPYHAKNLAACIAVEKFGLDIVSKEKNE